MNYVISAVLGSWLVFSLVRSGAGAPVWAGVFLGVGLLAWWFVHDSRCPKCRRMNALAHADEGPGVREPGVGENVRQVHFMCHHCGHRLSRRALLAGRGKSQSHRVSGG